MNSTLGSVVPLAMFLYHGFSLSIKRNDILQRYLSKIYLIYIVYSIYSIMLLCSSSWFMVKRGQEIKKGLYFDLFGKTEVFNF